MQRKFQSMKKVHLVLLIQIQINAVFLDIWEVQMIDLKKNSNQFSFELKNATCYTFRDFFLFYIWFNI